MKLKEKQNLHCVSNFTRKGLGPFCCPWWALSSLRFSFGTNFHFAFLFVFSLCLSKKEFSVCLGRGQSKHSPLSYRRSTVWVMCEPPQLIKFKYCTPFTKSPLAFTTTTQPVSHSILRLRNFNGEFNWTGGRIPIVLRTNRRRWTLTGVTIYCDKSCHSNKFWYRNRSCWSPPLSPEIHTYLPLQLP